MRKRLRILWAALTQQWHQHTCRKCGTTQWIEGLDTWSDPSECVPCEMVAHEAWCERYQLRHRTKETA